MKIFYAANCIVCAMKKTFDAAISRGSQSNAAIKPVEIINRLRCKIFHYILQFYTTPQSVLNDN